MRSDAMTPWESLAAEAAHPPRMSDLFATDPGRAGAFSVEADGLRFDYSRTALTTAARDALFALADAAGLGPRRDAMFGGAPINESEGRAVLHMALRDPDGGRLAVAGRDVRPEIRDTLARMAGFARGVRSGAIAPPGGGRFAHVVHIGIGGSALGPEMALRALTPHADGPDVHVVSNIDGAHLTDVLARVDLRATLILIASKTFTTLETMTNAESARTALAAAVGERQAAGHFAAISSAVEKAAAFGIPAERVFGFGDYVGGRYSLWGPIGLSLMLAVGPERFREMLDGARAMDRHFCTAPWAANIPALLGLIGLWHHQICGFPTRAVLPYEQRLALLPAHLQQLEMESNGKSVGLDGAPLPHGGGPVVWGAAGTDCQHAFMQLVHQGSQVVPCEFLVGRAGHEAALAHHHRLLVANCLAQAAALMHGRADGPPHRRFAGNRPSTMLMYPRLTPFVLGQIVAAYEHRVFVEGVLLGLNSFDQWGVELGKEMAGTLGPAVAGEAGADAELDPAARAALDWLRGDHGPAS
jgi:glucose-6-phosphate isomerase